MPLQEDVDEPATTRRGRQRCTSGTHQNVRVADQAEFAAQCRTRGRDFDDLSQWAGDVPPSRQFEQYPFERLARREPARDVLIKVPSRA